MRRRWLIPVVGAAGYLVLHRLGRAYGSTRDERSASLPGDDLIVDATFVANHGISIEASPHDVWPWLLQVGWHRGGWYTARWVDQLLFPANRASAREILPEFQVLDVGDFVPDGPPETECGFVVQAIEPSRYLLLRSNSHLPLSWRTQLGAEIDWTWCFYLTATADGSSTRFAFRWRANASPWWLRLGLWSTIVPADLLMSRDMLRGIKQRAESMPATEQR